jgi:hypothetical protein
MTSKNNRVDAMRQIFMEYPGEVDFSSQESVSFDGKYLKPGELVEHPNPSMPLIEAICTRRTSRAYSRELVDLKTFEWLVSMAMNAPTACNEQQ